MSDLFLSRFLQKEVYKKSPRFKDYLVELFSFSLKALNSFKGTEEKILLVGMVKRAV